MLRKLRERAQNEKGFTLIELLVVILIIGILAAIAIPSFINQRAKGQDADAKAGVKTSAEAMETYATDNNGSYAGSTVSTLKNIEPTLNDYGSRLTIVGSPTTNTYEVQVQSERSTSVLFQIVRTSAGDIVQNCSVGTEDKGGCPNPGTADPGDDW